MSYDDRLVIKQRFELNGKDRVNTAKLINYGDFVQMFVTSGNGYSQMRIDKDAALQLINYFKKFVDKG
jgi:hypothetical protein